MMQQNPMISKLKFGFIGAGHMAQTIIKAWVDTGLVKPEQIFATNRTERKLQKVASTFGVQALTENEELVEMCDVVVLAVKPQDLYSALEPLSSSIQENQIVISLAAGIPIASLRKLLTSAKRLVRVMPNTPARIQKGVLGYCMDASDPGLSSLMEDLFSPLGYVVAADEGEGFRALTVAAASGIGFIFELMLYWQEWLEEYDFSPEVARKMTVETFLGAALLAEHAEATDLQELQRQVSSKKGVTAAGLASMQELEIERLLRYSFEKAALRDKQLGQTSV